MRRWSPAAASRASRSTKRACAPRSTTSVCYLTPVEFKRLTTLARRPGRVDRRDELLDLIYDDFRAVSDRTIDSHSKNLRRKIERVLPNRPLIQSVYGIGYKLELD